MMDLIRIVLVVCIVGLSHTHCYAYSPGNHKQPTIDSFSLYRLCQNKLPGYLGVDFSDKDAQIAAEANARVDKISFSRGWNWHFYDANFDYRSNQSGNIKKNFWGMNRSMHKIYQYEARLLNRLLEKKGSKKKIAKSAGRLMHFLQDMSVPAHVAPIYHGPGLKDAFDYYVPETRAKIEIGKSECDRLFSDVKVPVQVLEHNAKATLKSISKDSLSGSSWADYWLVYPEKKGKARKGFATYGKCGSSGFGDSKTRTCTVKDNSQFDDFYTERYISGVMAGLRLLIYINDEYQKQ